MFTLLKRLSNQPGGVRQRVIGIYAFLLLANLGAWAWAVLLFRDHPLLLGTALLAYGFGLRHAVDADHIAAIDNVIRKNWNRQAVGVVLNRCRRWRRIPGRINRPGRQHSGPSSPTGCTHG